MICILVIAFYSLIHFGLVKSGKYDKVTGYQNHVDTNGKIAFVTGASSGIGLASAKLLSALGTSVAIVSRAPDELEAIARDLPGSFPIAADLTHEEEAIRAFDDALSHYGRIDILVNNAARPYASSISEMDTASVRKIFQLNALTPLALMREAAEAMRTKGGAIVNVSSAMVLMKETAPGMSAYIASKHALTAFSKAAREELSAWGIAVSTVYPYLTSPDFFKNYVPDALPPRPRPPGQDETDQTENAAKAIVRAIATGEAELFEHDWMKIERNRT